MLSLQLTRFTKHNVVYDSNNMTPHTDIVCSWQDSQSTTWYMTVIIIWHPHWHNRLTTGLQNQQKILSIYRVKQFSYDSWWLSNGCDTKKFTKMFAHHSYLQTFEISSLVYFTWTLKFVLKRTNLNWHSKQTGTNLKSNYVFGFLFTGEVNVSKFAFTERTTNLEIIQWPFLPAKFQRIR